MNCTHPVLYDHPDGLRCNICGALISANDAADKPEVQEEKAVKTEKKPAKRKVAKADN
jgi:hypothetical protein